MKYGLCGHKATFGHDLAATVVKASAKAEMKYKNKQDETYIFASSCIEAQCVCMYVYSQCDFSGIINYIIAVSKKTDV